MVERIQLNRGELPKEFSSKKFKVKHSQALKHDDTYVSVVSLKNFADFIAQDKGSDLIFYSNIRNHLNSTSINKGISKTIEEETKNFWYYNNGITVVCDEIIDNNHELIVTAPQIVNGCQTAKTIYLSYKKVSNQTAEAMLNDGHILVRFIKVKKSLHDSDKKDFRDNVTRYTNSQNAVKGLDFYSLDQFQRELKSRMQKEKYYYEIQRGAFIAEKNRLKNKVQFTGNPKYDYLLTDFKSSKKYVLPAKEVIQAFTAGIKLMPNIAYGRANELTPTGKRWEEIMNEETKEYKIEAFLFPYLIWLYAKNTLNFNRQSDISYQRHSAFLFVATYFLLLIKVFEKANKINKIESINHPHIDFIKKVFQNEALNIRLLKATDKTLRNFFRDSTIKDALSDNMRGFIQNNLTYGSIYWMILEDKLNDEIQDNIVESEDWQQIKMIFLDDSLVRN